MVNLTKRDAVLSVQSFLNKAIKFVHPLARDFLSNLRLDLGEADNELGAYRKIKFHKGKIEDDSFRVVFSANELQGVNGMGTTNSKEFRGHSLQVIDENSLSYKFTTWDRIGKVKRKEETVVAKDTLNDKPIIAKFNKTIKNKTFSIYNENGDLEEQLIKSQTGEIKNGDLSLNLDDPLFLLFEKYEYAIDQKTKSKSFQRNRLLDSEVIELL